MQLKEIECPNCKFKIKKRIEESINVTEKPKSVKGILEGKINFSYCPKCNHKINHKTHVLLTYMDPPRWIWLVTKENKNPYYSQRFFKNILPPGYNSVIDQEMVFVEFGKPCESLKFILEDKLPQTSKQWLELGKILTGKKAIECYKNALELDESLLEAKKLIKEEMNKIKNY